MKEDIQLLIEHFMIEISKRKKKEPPKISPEVMNYLVNYKWPGNVRELENLIERLIILNDGDLITPGDLPERLLDKGHMQEVVTRGNVLSSEGVNLNLMLDEIENKMILQALEISRGIKSKAASLLGLNRTTLIEKMKKKAIDFKPEA
jgi:DNA-binding NtrC family response regulator